jgi:predicted TPR repeat methyltransferase
MVDPTDPLGAGLKRDLLLATGIHDTMPTRFVENLFDQYAPHFEESLVEKLNYRGPEIILQALLEQGFSHARLGLDLGCGTGLMGVAIRPFCDRLEGYDISAGMLAQARRKNIYDALSKQDIAQLQVGSSGYDLIVAADVFMYLGALERIVGWCKNSLSQHGILGFTVETGDHPVELRDSRRFAHSQNYIETLLMEAGFSGIRITPCTLRQDRGEDVAALCVVATHNPFRHDREPDTEVFALV